MCAQCIKSSSHQVCFLFLFFGGNLEFSRDLGCGYSGRNSDRAGKKDCPGTKAMQPVRNGALAGCG